MVFCTKAISKLLVTVSATVLTLSINVQAKAPAEPFAKYENGKYSFSTFVTAGLEETDKDFMRDCLGNKQRLMSIDYTGDKPLFSFCIVPADASFIGFENAEINGTETMVASFDREIERIIFEAQNNQYIFKTRQADSKINISYLIDSTYFNTLDQVEIPQLSYDWQKYIPALIQDDDGLETSAPIQASSETDSAKAIINTEVSPTSQIKDYIWIGVGVLVGLLAIVAIIKLLSKEKKQG